MPLDRSESMPGRGKQRTDSCLSRGREHCVPSGRINNLDPVESHGRMLFQHSPLENQSSISEACYPVTYLQRAPQSWIVDLRSPIGKQISTSRFPTRTTELSKLKIEFSDEKILVHWSIVCGDRQGSRIGESVRQNSA